LSATLLAIGGGRALPLGFVALQASRREPLMPDLPHAEPRRHEHGAIPAWCGSSIAARFSRGEGNAAAAAS
jgi:hypothetical protein